MNWGVVDVQGSKTQALASARRLKNTHRKDRFRVRRQGREYVVERLRK